MATATPRKLGIIGGSGLYEVQGLTNVRERWIDTPFGAPTGTIMTGVMNGVDVAFLPRHGAGHRIAPQTLNYRANIDAMKRLGVTDLISISACGSLKQELPPGSFVIVDQFIDRTSGRASTFFDSGCVAHVSMADPVCPALAKAAAASCAALKIPYQASGTYICINGPQFSSRAESLLYKSWGCDVIGMTNMPEAKLAREAELPYATVAMVTDYDCWREEDNAVDVTSVLKVMRENTKLALKLIDDLTKRLGPTRAPSPLGIETCLDHALITPPEARDPALVAKLQAVAGRAFKAGK